MFLTFFKICSTFCGQGASTSLGFDNMSSMEGDLSGFLEKAKLRSNRVKGRLDEANTPLDRRPTLTLGQWSWLILKCT